MKKIIYILLLTVLPSFALSQDLLFEGFEAYDSLTLPTGWSRVNLGPDPPVEEFIHWIVRDTGVGLPGLSNATSKAHSGLKSIGTSWYAGLDTGGATLIADSWLISKRVTIPSSGYELSFWVSGGSNNYADSMQFLISSTDSLPNSFVYQETFYWPAGSTYGLFEEKGYDLSPYAGQTIWLAWRYYMDVDFDGFYVFLDDVRIYNPNGIVPINTNIPTRYDMKQNYPNPFNPVTNIEFDLPKSGNVRMSVFNAIGEEVRVLVNEFKAAGSYRVDFDASGMPSGTYFYRIISGDFVMTKKMTLVK